MKAEDKITLGSVQETLLLPLWGRAVETKKKRPLLVDQKAVSIIETIPYDFGTIAKNVNKLSMVSWIARSIYFDKKINEFITKYPEATIVNVGCGLDTTFDRVDNGKIQWIDLDLPDSIALRRNYIAETKRRLFVAKSVFDASWYAQIRNKQQVMLLIAGVLYYFDEPDIKNLFNDFHTHLPGVEIIFDYASKTGIKLSNKAVIEKGGMDKSAYLKWGIDDIFEIEKWNDTIKVIHTMPMFKEHKKNDPNIKRIGMNKSNSMKIMSLAHIRID
jgi:O-methyltransferase involved in polyketide biosynthesis